MEAAHSFTSQEASSK